MKAVIKVEIETDGDLRGVDWFEDFTMDIDNMSYSVIEYDVAEVKII